MFDSNLREQFLQLAGDMDEKVLWARIWDALVRAETMHFPSHTFFLDVYMQRKIMDFWSKIRKQASFILGFWGGHAAAERRIAVFVPEDYWMDADTEEKIEGLAEWPELWGEDPLAYLRVEFSATPGPGHRDLLGAALGLGIDRENMGDILLREGGADLILRKELLPFFRDAFVQAGRFPLGIRQPIAAEALIYIPPTFENRKINIPSLRLDSVMAAIWNLNREDVQELIRKGKVSVDGRFQEKPAYLLHPGHCIRCRGLGKAYVGNCLGESKKGRIFLEVQLFRPNT